MVLSITLQLILSEILIVWEGTPQGIDLIALTGAIPADSLV